MPLSGIYTCANSLCGNKALKPGADLPLNWLRLKLEQDISEQDGYVFTEIFCSKECFLAWVKIFIDVKTLVEATDD